MKIYSGTTLLVLIVSDYMIVGADSYVSSEDGPIEQMTKLACGHNWIVACEGLGTFHCGDTHYRVDEWMVEVQRKFPVATNASTIAEYISTDNPFSAMWDHYQVSECLWTYQRRKEHLAEFVIASAAPEGFSVMTVRTFVDDKEYEVASKTTVICDRRPPVNPFLPYPVGRCAQIKEAFRGHGDAHQKMLIRTHGSFGRLFREEKIGLDELRNIARVSIALEAEAHPETVGPPFVVAALQPSGCLAVMSYES